MAIINNRSKRVAIINNSVDQLAKHAVNLILGDYRCFSCGSGNGIGYIEDGIGETIRIRFHCHGCMTSPFVEIAKLRLQMLAALGDRQAFYSEIETALIRAGLLRKDFVDEVNRAADARARPYNASRPPSAPSPPPPPRSTPPPPAPAPEPPRPSLEHVKLLGSPGAIGSEDRETARFAQLEIDDAAPTSAPVDDDDPIIKRFANLEIE